MPARAGLGGGERPARAGDGRWCWLFFLGFLVIFTLKSTLLALPLASPAQVAVSLFLPTLSPFSLIFTMPLDRVPVPTVFEPA